MTDDDVIPPRRDHYGRAGDLHVYALAHGRVELRDRHGRVVSTMTASVARSLSKKLREAASDTKSWNYYESKHAASMVDVEGAA
jgi:hypothetical protein